MSHVLQGDQYPKGLSEEEVRTIAREEALKILGSLGEELSNSPTSVDGTINLNDFMMSLEIVLKKTKG
jgi:hypothetical protein